MALSDNKRLYDIATRIQLYTEGVKVQYAREFNFVLMKVRDVLTKHLHRVRYRTLDGLTKAELNRLILTLRESQSKIYSEYTTQIIEQLKAFMAADLEVNRRAWVTAFAELDDDEDEAIISNEAAIKFLEEVGQQSNPLFGIAAVTGNNERLWSQVTNMPIPTNGLYLVPFIKTFTTSAQAGVENIIRKAWANRWTVEETLAELVGTDERRQGNASQLARVGYQNTAVVHTAAAHVAAVVAAGVTSALFGRYGWYSVIDNSTTDVCRSRNRKIYYYGRGPLPPAHIKCRSHTAPVVVASDFADEIFYTWLVRQPDDLQDDLIGEDRADELRSGNVKARDFPRYENDEPLTLDAFRRKIREILTR